ncbi:MAG: hypothetical protein RLZZ182_1506, partial [Pseudomonadota bacterium]
MNQFVEAIVKHLSKVDAPSPRTAEQWSAIPRHIRERSFFSARVTNTAHLQELKDKINLILAPRTEQNEDGTYATRGIDVATARLELKQYLESIDYDPGAKAGTIQDLSSDQRINLQLNQNVRSARGFGQFIQGTAPGAIDAFPAQELFRAEGREKPRDWETRWTEAGGQLFDGRMIALKADPIWEAISAFGVPYPPFDYGSGMWVRDIDRDEAVALGLIGEDENAPVPDADFHVSQD